MANFTYPSVNGESLGIYLCAKRSAVWLISLTNVESRTFLLVLESWCLPVLIGGVHISPDLWAVAIWCSVDTVDLYITVYTRV